MLLFFLVVRVILFLWVTSSGISSGWIFRAKVIIGVTIIVVDVGIWLMLIICVINIFLSLIKLCLCWIMIICIWVLFINT